MRLFFVGKMPDSGSTITSALALFCQTRLKKSRDRRQISRRRSLKRPRQLILFGSFFILKETKEATVRRQHHGGAIFPH